MHDSTTELLDELTRAARADADGLEALGKLPHGFTRRHYPLTAREQRELHRLKNIAKASTSADVFVALCRGESVPISRLNPVMVEKYFTGGRSVSRA